MRPDDETTQVPVATIIQLPVRYAAPPVARRQPSRPSAAQEFKAGLAPFFRGFWIVAFWGAVINLGFAAVALPEVGAATALVYMVIAVALNLV